MENFVKLLYQSQNTIVNYKDLALIWQETNENKLKNRVAYCVKRGYLRRLTRGIFAKDKNYDPRELATSLYTPSYISFETVFRDAGMIFQYYETIFVAGPWARDIRIQGNKYTFRKLKDVVLYNPRGVINSGNISIATPERAFLDMIYLAPGYYFDNLRPLKWPVCFELVKIYNNRQLIKRLDKYYQDYVNDSG
ncbi:MAG: hypothetical protein HYV42_00370 [Candidatus Magasanikbacteria bacterium]|nr:hypothetical protein [Candidatus Magasanikbacteria bacterium]